MFYYTARDRDSNNQDVVEDMILLNVVREKTTNHDNVSTVLSLRAILWGCAYNYWPALGRTTVALVHQFSNGSEFSTRPMRQPELVSP